LSRGNPEFGKERQQTPPFIRHRQWERRYRWAKQMEVMMNDIQTKQEAAVEVGSEGDCNKKIQIRSEITETIGKQASPEPRASIIPEDRAQERNSKKVCGRNITVQQYDAIKANDVVENSNNSDGNSVKDTCVVNTDQALITQESTEVNGSRTVKNPANVDNKTNEHEQKSTTEINNFRITNEQNRNRGAECHISEGDGTIVTSENCSTVEGGTEEYSQSLADKSERMLLVLPDSDSDYEGYLNNVCPRLEEEQFPIHETLHLTLEEAFFLSFSLGCLQVIDLFGNRLSLNGMWQLFRKSQKDFIQKYVTYHYFRSKGWVVKPGIKFGGDFCKLNLYVNFFIFPIDSVCY
jgi:tRNA-splicing endonuclease subunit Sen2